MFRLRRSPRRHRQRREGWPGQVETGNSDRIRPSHYFRRYCSYRTLSSCSKLERRVFFWERSPRLAGPEMISRPPTAGPTSASKKSGSIRANELRTGAGKRANYQGRGAPSARHGPRASPCIIGRLRPRRRRRPEENGSGTMVPSPGQVSHDGYSGETQGRLEINDDLPK